jgi:hypothetical protein
MQVQAIANSAGPCSVQKAASRHPNFFFFETSLKVRLPFLPMTILESGEDRIPQGSVSSLERFTFSFGLRAK